MEDRALADIGYTWIGSERRLFVGSTSNDLPMKTSDRSDPRQRDRDAWWSWLSIFRPKKKEEAAGAWRFVFLSLLFLFPLARIFVNAAFAGAMVAGSGGGRNSSAGSIAFFLLVTWCPLALGIIAVRESRTRRQLSASILVSIFFLLLSLISCANVADYLVG
ncbi:MAG TPA: hypothetical protein VFB27_12505 [Opitutaceae bacterium]|nr:hypothetical protein [Opitutaceae bacterium]